MKMMVSWIDCSSLFPPCRGFARLDRSPTPVCSALSCLSSLVFALTELPVVAPVAPFAQRGRTSFVIPWPSSSSLSPSSASCFRFSRIYPSCFALTHHCWSVTVTLSKTLVFPHSSHRRSSPHCDPVEVSFPREHRFLSLSRRFCTASLSQLVDRLVCLSLSWSWRGHLQSQQVSKVPWRLWLLVVASFALQLLDSQFPSWINGLSGSCMLHCSKDHT